MKWLTLVSWSVFVLTACDKSVELKNGIIPQEYVSYVKAFEGNYSGEFEGQRVDFSVTLDENTLKLNANPSFMSKYSCGDKVREPVSLWYSQKDKSITAVGAVEFSIDLGNCTKESIYNDNAITFLANIKNNKIESLSAKIKYNEVESCRETCTGSPVDGTDHCYETCTTHDRTWKGNFKKL